MKYPYFLLFLCCIGTAHAQGVEPDTLVAYKEVDGVVLRMHVFLPEGEPEGVAALVYYFGGGWNGGSPVQFYPHAEHFAKRGMVVFGVEYRIKNTHGTSPFESIADAMSSMRWVRANAENFGVDPGRIVASGGSAGGHLAAATGMIDGYDSPDEDLSVSRVPNALVLFNPVIDNGPDGYGYERIGEAYPEFSPYHNVDASTPPMTILLGTNDALIPVQTMVAFQEAVQARGVRCDLHLYGGQPHGFFNYREGKNPYYNETVAAMETFLMSLGFFDDF